MKEEIFAYRNYKKYLLDFIKAQPSQGHGQRLRLAKFVQCQVGYVSQVLNGSAHFSLEQAERVNRFLKHSQEESHYFLLLVQAARAGTEELKEYFHSLLEQVSENRLLLKNRLKTNQPLNELNQAKYYSSWYYAAVHILLAIPHYRRRPAIAQRLQLDPEKVNEILDFLQEAGLVTREGSEYKINTGPIHLGADSPLISKHHLNWRMHAMRALERAGKQDLHYSSVLSLGKADFQRIRERLVKEIEEIRKIVRDSPEEDLYVITLDWYEA